jgi:hypothetical protein
VRDRGSAGVEHALQTQVHVADEHDAGRIVRERGLEFLDIDVTLKDTVADLEGWGHVPPLAPAAA